MYRLNQHSFVWVFEPQALKMIIKSWLIETKPLIEKKSLVALMGCYASKSCWLVLKLCCCFLKLIYLDVCSCLCGFCLIFFWHPMENWNLGWFCRDFTVCSWRIILKKISICAVRAIVRLVQHVGHTVLVIEYRQKDYDEASERSQSLGKGSAINGNVCLKGIKTEKSRFQGSLSVRVIDIKLSSWKLNSSRVMGNS